MKAAPAVSIVETRGRHANASISLVDDYRRAAGECAASRRYDVSMAELFADSGVRRTDLSSPGRGRPAVYYRPARSGCQPGAFNCGRCRIPRSRNRETIRRGPCTGILDFPLGRLQPPGRTGRQECLSPRHLQPKWSPSAKLAALGRGYARRGGGVHGSAFSMTFLRRQSLNLPAIGCA